MKFTIEPFVLKNTKQGIVSEPLPKSLLIKLAAKHLESLPFGGRISIYSCQPSTKSTT